MKSPSHWGTSLVSSLVSGHFEVYVISIVSYYIKPFCVRRTTHCSGQGFKSLSYVSCGSPIELGYNIYYINVNTCVLWSIIYRLRELSKLFQKIFNKLAYFSYIHIFRNEYNTFLHLLAHIHTPTQIRTYLGF